MLQPVVFLGTVLVSFTAGYVIVIADTVLPLVLGRQWRSHDAKKRYAIGLVILDALVALGITVAGQTSFGRNLPEGVETLYFFSGITLAALVGVFFAIARLTEAPEIIEAIINSMFPSGGAIRLGAEDVGAASKVMAFLEKLGTPYRSLLLVVADGINNPLTSWYLLGVFTRFTELSEDDRKLFVQKWMKNENIVFRSLSHAFKALGSLGYYTDPRVWKEIGFPEPCVPELPRIVPHKHQVPWHTHVEGDEAHPVHLGSTLSDDEPEARIFGITRFQERSRKYKLIQSDIHLQADVCIIGSGAGGAVIAWELASKSDARKIVMLERGSYYEGEDFNQRELDMLALLWKGGALTFNQDFSIFIGQGETLGGTTVINHAICIDTPSVVLEDWARLGVAWASDQISFNKILSEVKNEIHVHPPDPRQINKNNEILKNWALKAAIASHGPNPRNDLDCRECGFSHLGCHYDSKQSTLVTYIPKALDTKKFAVFCDCYASQINFNGDHATGVDAVLMTKNGEEKYRLHVDANVVVVSAGAVNSTALILRSKPPGQSKSLGRRLTIHPSPLVIGEFPDNIEAYKGIPMSYHISEYSVVNGVPAGGYMLESVFPNPGQLAAFLPGVGEEHKQLMKNMNKYAAAGILIRDTPKGKVSRNQSGDPVIQYKLDDQDKTNLCNGIRKLCEIYFNQGATRVVVTHRTGTIITQEEYRQDPDVLVRKIRPDNCGQEDLYMGAVHPQGGNPMGRSPEDSVVDSNCKYHGVGNLFVCDASVFPTATGVNPMLTIMGVAKRTAEHIRLNLQTLMSGGHVQVDADEPWFRPAN